VVLAVAALGAGAVPAEDIGRLFTTEAQRASLDELREMARLQAETPEPQPAPRADPELPEPPAIERLTVDGVVRPSSGPGVVWINGDLVQRSGVTREGLQVELEGGRSGVRVHLPGDAGSVALKPGQQVEVRSGAVLEPWERSRRPEGTGASATPESHPVPPAVAAPAAGGADAPGGTVRASVPGAAPAGGRQ
jgi:hypothetical protein